jgi:hypothetical protein
VEGILDQFCISRLHQGRLRKFGSSASAAPITAFPFQVGAAVPRMQP